jgi:parallel beta-helix repeat protein
VTTPPAAPPQEAEEAATVEVRKRSAAPALVMVFLMLAAGGSWYFYTQYQERMALQVEERLVFLESLGGKMLEARQWPEATAAYEEIENLRPGSEVAKRGRREIEAGREEEQRQFVGYWSGEAIAAYDLGRLDEAASAARQVLDKYPNEKEMAELFAKVEQARSTQAREALLKAAAAAIQKRRWDEAETKAKELANAFPGDAQGNVLLSEIRMGRERDAKDRVRARELYVAAKARDLGQFDRDALEWLREAVALAPGDPEIDALYQKMASYTRTLQVPGDYPGISEAVAAARDRDRIVVAEGTWAGPVIVNKAIALEGAGKDKTIIEVDAAASNAATFSGKGGARASGITFRHRGFDPGPNRYAVVLVKGGELTMNDCRVADSSGHGLAVTEAGQVAGTRCVFENNGWNGVAVQGRGSRIEFSQCEATGNFGHGYELWDGGSGAIHESSARDNSAAGIVVDTTADNVVIGKNELRGNREYGIVVRSATGGRVHDNQCRENLLGGMAVRFAAAKVLVENNVLEKNHGPGLALERGLPATAFATNRATANANGVNTATDRDFSSGE